MSDVVWEALIDTQGDSVLLNSDFTRSSQRTSENPGEANIVDTDRDHAIALEIQQQEQIAEQQRSMEQLAIDEQARQGKRSSSKHSLGSSKKCIIQ